MSYPIPPSASRRIGRVRWAGLKVRDRRTVTTTDSIASDLGEHRRVADNGGRIQSVITVLAPGHPLTGPRAHVRNDQLIRYCGWQPNDQVLRYYDTRVPDPNFWPGARTPYSPEPTLRERHYLASRQEG